MFGKPAGSLRAFYPRGKKLGQQGRHTNTRNMKSRSQSLIAAQTRTECAQDLKLSGQFPTVRPALASKKYPALTLIEVLKPLAETAPFADAYADQACDLKTIKLLADISRELDKLLWLLAVRQNLNKCQAPNPSLTDSNTHSRVQFGKG
jgi:hypothetical protein